MNKILTIEEINRRYLDQWVLIGDPETDESLEVRRGQVRFYSQDRDEVYGKIAELDIKQSAVVYTGDLPEDMEFAL